MGVRILAEVPKVIFALLCLFTSEDRGGCPGNREMGSIQSIYAEQDKIYAVKDFFEIFFTQKFEAKQWVEVSKTSMIFLIVGTFFEHNQGKTSKRQSAICDTSLSSKCQRFVEACKCVFECLFRLSKYWLIKIREAFWSYIVGISNQVQHKARKHKCHRYDKYICVKISLGKRFGRLRNYLRFL